MSSRLILVRGTGDVASAVAHLLFTQGHRVLCHDIAAPTYSRRGMAFVDAVFEGTATLDGVLARRADSLEAAAHMLGCRKAVPVTTADFRAVLDMIGPSTIVDARMRKRAEPEKLLGLAPLTIGLGPNFVAGETVDVAIETAWGDALGEMVERGPTRALAGEPRAIDGRGRERFVYAPRAGLFLTGRHIGDDVAQGTTVATIEGESLPAPLSGRIRGLTHDRVPVEKGAKVIEIDPRGERAAVLGLGERPRRIAAGVLRAIDANTAKVPLLFAFEAEFESALQCIPMLARLKLDACGIKVSLPDWRKLPLSVRQMLLEMPAATGEQCARYHGYLTEEIERHTQGPPQVLAGDPAPAWSRVDEVAPTVVQAAEAAGTSPPSVGQWRTLTPLQRFALVKLAKDGRGHRNLASALREFGLG